MPPCPFCSLESSRKWTDNEHAVAFPDAYPVTDGHTLVVPRKHVGSVYEISAKEQSAIWDLVAEVRERLLITLKPDAWKRLVRNVERVVTVMALWKLQTVGKEKLDFLYEEAERDGKVELRAGVAYCFRQFYSLIQDAVRSAWLRDVRSLNGDLLGETLDLREFLFGAERSPSCGQARADGLAKRQVLLLRRGDSGRWRPC
jgi:hypothetical protein